MAYGQTSSGKSYTLIGNNERPGLIPRFSEDLIGLKEYLSDSSFSITCSFFEIYNEAIFDLLNMGMFLLMQKKLTLC